MNAIQKNGVRLAHLVDTCISIAASKSEGERIRSYAVQRLGLGWEWDAGKYERTIASALLESCSVHKSGGIFREALWALACDPRKSHLGYVQMEVERVLRDPVSPDHDLAFRIISEKSIHSLNHVLQDVSKNSTNALVRENAQGLLRDTAK
jgi:hypothetical protein